MLRKIIETAFAEAAKAMENGDIPIGAVIFDLKTKEIIASAGNEVEKQQNPLAHAEILAINKALSVLKTNRLENCGIYTTLEPCTMCEGAISHAHIHKLIFGAYQILKEMKEYKPEDVFGGFEETRSKELIRDFFNKIREKTRKSRHK